MKYLHMESKKKDHEIYKPELWVDSNIYHHKQYVKSVTLSVLCFVTEIKLREFQLATINPISSAKINLILFTIKVAKNRSKQHPVSPNLGLWWGMEVPDLCTYKSCN